MLGLVPLGAGRVELFGMPLRRFRQWHRIGYVPQRLGAGGGVPATVGEVVASGRLARRGVLRPAGARRPGRRRRARWTRSASPTGPATRSPPSPAGSSSAP